MKQNEKRLLTASRWWAHDAKVIEYVCTDSAQCALLAEWTVRCMPSFERCIDVASSVRNSKTAVIPAFFERWGREKAVKKKIVEACRFFVTWSFFMPVSFQEEVRAVLVKLKGDGSSASTAGAATASAATRATTAPTTASKSLKPLKEKAKKAIDDDDRLLAEMLKAA
eukprot:3740531-Amphidinium_carterae.1